MIVDIEKLKRTWQHILVKEKAGKQFSELVVMTLTALDQEYKRGRRDGVGFMAWSKGGTWYVGNGTYTLERALEIIDKEGVPPSPAEEKLR